MDLFFTLQDERKQSDESDDDIILLSPLASHILVPFDIEEHIMFNEEERECLSPAPQSPLDIDVYLDHNLPIPLTPWVAEDKKKPLKRKKEHEGASEVNLNPGPSSVHPTLHPTPTCTPSVPSTSPYLAALEDWLVWPS
jgi:hypothetical protein